VEVDAESRRARHELDCAIVVRRSEPTGDDAEVRRERIAQGGFELFWVAADDLDPRGREAEPEDFLCEPRPVAVRAVAADELAAGYHENGARPLHLRAARDANPVWRHDDDLRPAARQVDDLAVQQRLQHLRASDVDPKASADEELRLTFLERSLVDDRPRQRAAVHLEPARVEGRADLEPRRRSAPRLHNRCERLRLRRGLLCREARDLLVRRATARPRDDHERGDERNPEQRQEDDATLHARGRGGSVAGPAGGEHRVVFTDDVPRVVLVDVELAVQPAGLPVRPQEALDVRLRRPGGALLVLQRAQVLATDLGGLLDLGEIEALAQARLSKT